MEEIAGSEDGGGARRGVGGGRLKKGRGGRGRARATIQQERPGRAALATSGERGDTAAPFPTAFLFFGAATNRLPISVTRLYPAKCSLLYRLRL